MIDQKFHFETLLKVMYVLALCNLENNNRVKKSWKPLQPISIEKLISTLDRVYGFLGFRKKCIQKAFLHRFPTFSSAVVDPQTELKLLDFDKCELKDHFPIFSTIQ